MTYNLHPLIVHIPIALLFFYSLIKILPVRSWFPKTSWITTERFLLLIGTIGIFLATSSGEVAKDITHPAKDIVAMHELFANATTWFYVALVVIEFLDLLVGFLRKKKIIAEKVSQKIYTVSLILKKKWLILALSVFGLLALFITGLLGGVLTHGLGADPLAPLVLKILGL